MHSLRESALVEKFNIIFPAMDIRIPPPHPFFYKEPSWLLGELRVVPSGATALNFKV